ncbi:segregation and condensation protein A [Salinicoccus halodurans]|uniref:Segregation and condensation protein A n=1 Tax=Salinicoccus halodurans TaxID=407035 RepID=A0AA94KV47_9STAP|nr:segregation/condensation protein A [Salinicoccus halodurans]SFK59825.1 condensin subunit ScpA [Salinicoccus halodurans]
MDVYNVKLDIFEGPLDLLLHLIKELEIDIYDIPMKTLTKQYMEYIDQMKELEINIASEYLVMASELLKIKSHMLLPEPAYMEEEYEDPREALMEQLLEYQNYKQYAEQLQFLKNENEKIFVKAPHEFDEEEVDDGEVDISLSDLLAAYEKVRSRVSIDRPMSVTIQREAVSREEAEDFLKTRFSGLKRLNFTEIFSFNESRSMVVAVFITILEQVKSRELALHPASRGNFEIERL